jgi:multiple sugar transport system substrate-binding protein
MDKEQLLDRKAIGEAIKAVGENTFYDGILRVVRTEDGTAWTGVPISAWLSGVWYHKDVLAAAGIEEPHNWEQLLKPARALTTRPKTLRHCAAHRGKRDDRAGILPVCAFRRRERF